MADIFDVISDSTRRDILAILLTKAVTSTPELSVSDLVAQTALTQPTVSKQLKVLRDAGLVSVREDGQHRYYRLDASPLAAIAGWLEGFTVTSASSAGGSNATGGASTKPGGATRGAAPTPGQSVLPEDVRTVASEAGAAAATALFRVREAWGDLKVQARDAAERAAAELRKRP